MMKPKAAPCSSSSSCSLNLSYVRIVLALAGYAVSANFPSLALFLWMLGAMLDISNDPNTNDIKKNNKKTSHDSTKQTSQRKRIHVLALDLLADNLLRTVGWTAAAVAQPSPYLAVAVAIVLLEWTTLIATHIHVAWDAGHWKRARCGTDPAWMQALLRSRGQNVLGRLALFGLLTADWVCFAAAKGIDGMIPCFALIQVTALVGRAVVAAVELWLCATFGAFLVQKLQVKKDSMVHQSMTETVMDAVSLHVTKVL